MPKELNKEKLRKAAKGLGLGVLSVFATIGIVATIACLARCGESPKQEASAEDVSLSYVRQPRKNAPMYDEDANVFVGDDYQFYLNVAFRATSTSTSLTRDEVSWGAWGTSCGRVRRAGLYYLHVPFRTAQTSVYNLIVTGNSLYKENFDEILHSESVAFSNDSNFGFAILGESQERADWDAYVYVTQEQVDAGYYVFSRSSWDNPPTMVAVDMLEASPSDKVSLPEGWKPYNLMDCEPKQNGWGVCNARTTASLSPLGYGMLDGLLFRSNGKLYNRIRIEPWSPYVDNSTAHTFGYYDASGKLVWKTLGGDTADLILKRIVFDMVFTDLPNNVNAPTEVTSDVVAYCPEASVIVEQQARVVYLSAGPLTWNSPLFQELDVLDVYDEQVKPTDTLMARSPLEWLRLGLAEVNPSTPTTDVGIQDGMTLVSDGIVAFMPILGIEVLPSITLGLLLILPLIGGIIVLIVKVFSK